MAVGAQVSARRDAVEVEFCGQVFSPPRSAGVRGLSERGLLALGGALAREQRPE
jgi:hypothetical protein